MTGQPDSELPLTQWPELTASLPQPEPNSFFGESTYIQVGSDQNNPKRQTADPYGAHRDWTKGNEIQR